jgi:peptidoglycan/xylan/chitin deacetylase (PgdA/CDA1 family)
VRLTFAVTLVAFLGVLLCWQAPGVLLGTTSLNQNAAPTRNPNTEGLSSVIRFDEGRLESPELPARTVALTFDDGPSAEWTPRLQEVLDRHGVPGTFFVIGSQVMRHPEIVRSLDRAGHEIGNHSFTHPRLGGLPAWQAELQVSLTERAVVGAIGKRTQVFRPPYSGHIEYLPQPELDAAQVVSAGRYLSVLSDRAPKDFDLEVSVHDLVADAMPAIGSGAVITFHDGGGDRANTVAAVDEVIRQLKGAGYRFARASELAMTPETAREASAPTETRLAAVMVEATRAVHVVTHGLWYAGLAFIGLTVARASLLIGLSHRAAGQGRRRTVPDGPAGPVTVIVPAYNEGVGIERTVRSIVASNHPDVWVIVVDDGSSDETAALVERMDLDRVRVIRQPNLGKAAALQRGLAEADSELIVMIDGDTLFEPTTITELVRPFADPAVGAVAGNAKVGNRRHLLGRLQHLEYTVSSCLERRMLEQLSTATCIPGAVGAYRRTVLEAVGGPRSDTLAEDADLTMTIVRSGSRVAFAPAARGWTEVPTTLRGFYRQRRRWAYGILQALAKHRHAVLERGPSGRLGRRVILYQLIACYLSAVIAPAIDLIIMYNLVFDPGARRASLTILGLLVAVNVVLHGYALHLDGERLRHVLLVPLQQVAYRHTVWLATFRALQAAVFGAPQRWNKLRRTGDAVAPMGGLAAVPLAPAAPVRGGSIA